MGDTGPGHGLADHHRREHQAVPREDHLHHAVRPHQDLGPRQEGRGEEGPGHADHRHDGAQPAQSDDEDQPQPCLIFSLLDDYIFLSCVSSERKFKRKPSLMTFLQIIK